MSACARACWALWRFFVFAVVLEQIIHFLVLGLNGTVSDFILSRPWLYAVYGGFMAGFIEESARFLVFKTMMRDNVGRENAVSYGLGHGGLECFSVLGMTMISNLMLAVMFNSIGAEEFIAQYAPGQTAAISEAIAGINAIDPAAAALACFERACSMALQVELSILVFGARAPEQVLAVPRQHSAPHGRRFLRGALSDRHAERAVGRGGPARGLRGGAVLCGAGRVQKAAARGADEDARPFRPGRIRLNSARTFRFLPLATIRRRRVPLNFMLLHKNRKTY